MIASESIRVSTCDTSRGTLVTIEWCCTHPDHPDWCAHEARTTLFDVNTLNRVKASPNTSHGWNVALMDVLADGIDESMKSCAQVKLRDRGWSAITYAYMPVDGPVTPLAVHDDDRLLGCRTPKIRGIAGFDGGADRQALALVNTWSGSHSCELRRPQCSCAMTESSQAGCALHGENALEL